MRASLEFPARCSSGLPILLVGAIALGAGVYLRNSGVLAFATVLIGAPALLYYMLRRSSRGLQVERQAPESAYEGDKIEVAFRVQNRSRLPLLFPKLRDVFGPEIHTQKDLLFPGRIAAGEVSVQRYHGFCILPRGIHLLGPGALRLFDPYGWFELRSFTAGRHSLKVYPKLLDFGVEERAGRWIASVCEDRTRGSVGHSNEFLTVREYQRGDPPNRIHWPLTAHAGAPMVRQFARPAIGSLAICIDTHRDSLVGWGKSSSVEHAVKIAATAAQHALRQGRKVKLVAGARAEDRVEEDTGSVQLQRILDLVVKVRANRDGPPFLDLIEDLGAALRTGSTLLVTISPYLFENHDFEEALGSLRDRGVRVAAVVFDDRSFRRSWGAPVPSTRNAEECAKILRAAGIDVFRIPCGAPLETLVAEERR